MAASRGTEEARSAGRVRGVGAPPRKTEAQARPSLLARVSGVSTKESAAMPPLLGWNGRAGLGLRRPLSYGPPQLG